MPVDRRKWVPPIVFLAVSVLFFWGLSQWMAGVWKFDFFVTGGDVFTYWQESLTWGYPFHPHHPPGYPWLIGVVRAAAGSRLEPLAVMQSLTFVFLLGGAYRMTVLCRREGIAHHGWTMAVLYIAWPFVGSLYAVYPQIDAIILFLLILGILLAMDGRWIASGAVWGAATLAHPLAWIFVPILLPVPWAVWIWENKKAPAASRSIDAKRLLAMTTAAAAPLAALWIWETVVTKDPLWALASILNAQVVSRGSFPFLDGWIGTVAGNGISGWMKVGILSLVVLAALYLLASTLRKRTAAETGQVLYREIVSLLIPAGILVMAVLLNQHEIWAVVRFSKILLLPLILQRDRLFGFIPRRLRAPALYGLIGLGIVTQVVYAWYMATVFFPA